MSANQLLYQHFRQEFNTYYEQLCQYAFNIVKEPHACEDIVQEIFVHIWEKKQELIGTDAIRFYLFVAVRNNCLNYLQKARKSPLVPISGQEFSIAPVSRMTAEKVEEDFSVLFQQALDRLPPKCREVFVLSRMSKLTYQEIAETMELSIKTVENHMGKALKIMRSFLREKEIYLLFWAVHLFIYIL